MEYNCGYINGGYGAFTFEDPLSEDENEDIHHAVQYSIFESNSAEMNIVESSYTEEDEHHTGSVQGSTEHSDESVRQRRKASITPRKGWWRKLFSSLNIFKKFKQYDVTSWESSTSERDSNCQINQVCDVCDEAILSDRLMRTYWGQTACSKHSSDGTTKCCSCKRFKDQPENPLGMTTYGGAGFVVRSVARSYLRGENIHVVEEVQYIRRIYEVTSMLIVYGYPRLAIGATIAHEMMHAWIRTEGYKGLKPEVEEGICQVMAHRWLDWYAFVGDDFLHATPEQAQFLRNLKEVWKNKIEIDYSRIYGDGFREAKWAIERYGLKRTMSHVAQTGNFPQ